MHFRNLNDRDVGFASNMEAISAKYYMWFFNLTSTLFGEVATRKLKPAGYEMVKASGPHVVGKLVMVVLVTKIDCPLRVTIPFLVQAKIGGGTAKALANVNLPWLFAQTSAALEANSARRTCDFRMVQDSPVPLT